MHDLRRELKRQRKRISLSEQLKSETQVLNQLKRMAAFKTAQHIGVYLDAFGEIRTKKIIEYAFSRGKKVYLPCICAMNQRLVWIRISPQQFRNRRFKTHRLGMQEPQATRGQNVIKLDLLLLPLLACDATGTRMGMGGGFYDRTLAFAKQHKPFRLGLAHHFQFIPHGLTRQKWDQPLHALLTPNRLFRFKYRLTSYYDHLSGFIQH